MAFDGIVTKKIVDELQNIQDYKVDKIYQPDKNTVILGLYGNYTNVSILACISSNNYRIHLTTNLVKNPTIAPNFCMLLRKHILGYKIKDIYTKSLERIVFIELENLENPDKPIYKTLVIELMGKHSNIILLDENRIIIDALRHTSVEENAQRDIYPTSRYYEPISNKHNLLEINNFEEFFNLLKLDEDSNIEDSIVNTFNGIGLSNLKALTMDIKSKNEYTSQKNVAHIIYNSILEILNSKNLSIKTTSQKNDSPNDYCLVSSCEKNSYSLNFAIDDFYFSKENNEIFKNFRNMLLNIILSTLKKYEKRLQNIDEKLEECKSKDKYKLYGELLTANLYRIPGYNTDSISLENYYNNNELIKIPLDKKYSPQYNAKRYYKKYSKLKNALEIVSTQKSETINEIKYIESTIYELETCKDISDVQEIYDEISENEIFKNSFSKKNIFKKKSSKKPKKMTTNKFVSFNPLKFNIDGYTIYVGRNNKENDYLTNKFANKNDIWFHTKEIHIYEAAKLAANHSKAKSSSNIPVDYCLVQYVKKVPGNKPGLVIYRNNKTIYV